MTDDRVTFSRDSGRSSAPKTPNDVIVDGFSHTTPTDVNVDSELTDNGVGKEPSVGVHNSNEGDSSNAMQTDLNIHSDLVSRLIFF